MSRVGVVEQGNPSQGVHSDKDLLPELIDKSIEFVRRQERIAREINHHISADIALNSLSEGLENYPELSRILSDGSVRRALHNPQRMTKVGLVDIEGGKIDYCLNCFNIMVGGDFQLLKDGDNTYIYSDGYARRYLQGDRADLIRMPIKGIANRLRDRLREEGGGQDIIFEAEDVSWDETSDIKPGKRIPVKVKDIVIPTANRDCLGKTLKAMKDNLMMYGWSGIQVTIFDTSTDERQEERNRRIVEEAATEDIRFKHVGKREIDSFLKRISEGLGGDEKDAFDEVFLRRQDRLTIGAIRNIIAFYFSDTPYISVDDDVTPYAPIIKPELYGIKARQKPGEFQLSFESFTINDYERRGWMKPDEFNTHTVKLPVDFMSIVEGNLNVDQGDRPYYTIGENDGATEHDNSRVSFVRLIPLGDHTDVRSYLTRFNEVGDLSYLRGIGLNRAYAIQANPTLQYRGNSNATFFATSLTHKVPFLDLPAYEDGAQTYLTWLSRPNDLQYQGGGFFHDRFPESRGKVFERFMNTVLASQLLKDYLYPTLPGSYAAELCRDPFVRERMKKLADKMLADSETYEPSDYDVQRSSKALREIEKRLNRKKRRLIGREAEYAREHLEGFQVKGEGEMRDAMRTGIRKHLRRSGLIIKFWDSFQRAAEKTVPYSI